MPANRRFYRIFVTPLLALLLSAASASASSRALHQFDDGLNAPLSEELGENTGAPTRALQYGHRVWDRCVLMHQNQLISTVQTYLIRVLRLRNSLKKVQFRKNLRFDAQGVERERHGRHGHD